MSLRDLADEELMVMYQNGSEEAFQAIYQRHAERIYGFLRRRVWNEERAAELFQEVFLKLHRSKRLYNRSLPALPWIFSITRSVLVDGLRVDTRVARGKEESGPPPAVELPASAGGELTELLGRLPESQRRALELRYVDERTFEEIAANLKTSAPNARKIISRAVARLKSIARGKGD